MHPFVDTISIFGAVAIAIVGTVIVLTLFFRGLSWLSGSDSKTETFAIRGILKNNTLATVHACGGKKFERVCIIGFTDNPNMKTRFPFELTGMVILEDEQHQRYLIRAKDIQMIVVPPETK